MADNMCKEYLKQFFGSKRY
ncbi:SAV1978 family virulence-associated passenger protein, partial [Staphylococcus aureus]